MAVAHYDAKTCPFRCRGYPVNLPSGYLHVNFVAFEILIRGDDDNFACKKTITVPLTVDSGQNEGRCLPVWVGE
ncbi:MAG: hypothetical protein IPH75_16190 [bacterium]|nr:hypothetical protein [bacterium]